MKGFERGILILARSAAAPVAAEVITKQTTAYRSCVTRFQGVEARGKGNDVSLVPVLERGARVLARSSRFELLGRYVVPIEREVAFGIGCDCFLPLLRKHHLYVLRHQRIHRSAGARAECKNTGREDRDNGQR